MIYRALKKIENKLALRRAIKDGMIVGKECRFLGAHGFGTEPYLITIGNRVTVSSDVTFVNHDGGTAVVKRLNQEKYGEIIKYGRITIGDNCFIGYGTIIMPGVEIGNNCVIGAGSIVTKSIPSNSVAVGAPAKVIKSISEYAEKCLRETPEYLVEQYKAEKKATILQLY